MNWGGWVGADLEMNDRDYAWIIGSFWKHRQMFSRGDNEQRVLLLTSEPKWGTKTGGGR